MTNWLTVVQKRIEKTKLHHHFQLPASWKKSVKQAVLFRNLSLAFLILVIIGICAFAFLFAWYAKDLPRPDKVARRDGFSTKIFDRDQNLLYEVYTDQQRTPATIDQIPDTLKKAVVAIEDKNFYTHSGYDRQGYLRIVFNIITKRRLIGGSTLTQQLVKNVLLSTERTLTRKLKELILAVQIENKYTKDEILLMYLNESPYGGTAWGVATAAQIYFQKPVSNLTLLESAILAGLPQRPSYYSPLASSNKEAYKNRTKDVLRRMREDGYLTPEIEQAALAELTNLILTPLTTSIKAPHFVMYVKDQLINMYGEAVVEGGGLQVTTTLDLKLHQQAQLTVTEEIAKVATQLIGNGAAIVMDPVTGEIWSMVGSKDFFAKDYDGQVNVGLSRRQPGSTIKPITYALAFAKGYTPATMLMDVPTQFPGAVAGNPYEPNNYDGKFRGPVQLRFALGSSLNIPAVKLLALVGIPDMMQLAYDMGITTLQPTKENLSRFGLSLTLGGGEVRLLDLVQAYSAFGNGGLRVEPVAILKVADRYGKILYEHKPVTGKRVLDESVTFLINHILTDNNARLLTFGQNSYLNMNNRPIAVKTGTTNDRRDNWTIGWSNSAIAGVWVGNNDNSPMKNVTSGVTGASPIWRKIILETIALHKPSEWHIPENVEAKIVDLVSGYPEHDGFANRTEYVIKNTLPPLPDPIHHKIKYCKGLDKLATQMDIEKGEYEEKEVITPTENKKLGDLPSWQEQNEIWAQNQGDPKFKVPKEYCNSTDEILVRVDSPSDQLNVAGNTVDIKVRVVSTTEITKVEIYIDGVKGETLVDRPYETNLTLETGKHTIKIKALGANGKTGESGDLKIGVGGVSWDYVAPTPTPVPSPTPTPAPSPPAHNN